MGESQPPNAHLGSPPRAPVPRPRDPSPNQAGRKRALTWSQPDISRRGGNPRSPRTGIFRRGFRVGAQVQDPAPPPPSSLGRQVGPPTRSRVLARCRPAGTHPFVPPPLGAASARPRPEAAPQRPPPGPGNSQTGRYHPRATRGRVRRRRTLEGPAEGRVTRDSRPGTKEGGSSRGILRTERPAAPTPNPPPTGGPDGSLRGELCEQQVRLRAPAGGALQVCV